MRTVIVIVFLFLLSVFAWGQRTSSTDAQSLKGRPLVGNIGNNQTWCFATATKRYVPCDPGSGTVGAVSSVAGRTGAVALTPVDVGLGNLGNFSLASQAECEAGLLTSRYVSPLCIKQAITALGAPGDVTGSGTPSNEQFVVYDGTTGKAVKPLTSVNGIPLFASGLQTYLTTLGSGALVRSAGATLSGPLGLVPADVQLGSVDNLATASQAEAEAGTAIKFMTAQRTAQAIAALSGVAKFSITVDAGTDTITVVNTASVNTLTGDTKTAFAAAANRTFVPTAGSCWAYFYEESGSLKVTVDTVGSCTGTETNLTKVAGTGYPANVNPIGRVQITGGNITGTAVDDSAFFRAPKRIINSTGIGMSETATTVTLTATSAGGMTCSTGNGVTLSSGSSDTVLATALQVSLVPGDFIRLAGFVTQVPGASPQTVTLKVKLGGVNVLSQNLSTAGVGTRYDAMLQVTAASTVQSSGIVFGFTSNVSATWNGGGNAYTVAVATPQTLDIVAIFPVNPGASQSIKSASFCYGKNI